MEFERPSKLKLKEFQPGPPTFPQIRLPEEKGGIEIAIELLATILTKKGARDGHSWKKLHHR